MNIYNGKITAFTLVEVMMVIFILAVILVMITMTLMQNVSKVEQTAKLNAARSIITQAVIQYQAENLCNGNLSACDECNVVVPNTEEIFEAIFHNKFKTQKVCGMLLGQGCFAPTKYLNPDKTEFDSPDNSELYYKILLQNSISIGFYVPNPKCQDNICAKIIIDTNGPAGPNQINRDTFEGIITKSIIKFNLE